MSGGWCTSIAICACVVSTHTQCVAACLQGLAGAQLCAGQGPHRAHGEIAKKQLLTAIKHAWQCIMHTWLAAAAGTLSKHSCEKHSCHLPVSMLQQVCIIRSHLLDIQARWQHAICTNAVQTAALLPSDCLYIHHPPMTQHEDAGTSSLFCNHVLYMLVRVIGVLGKKLCLCCWCTLCWGCWLDSRR